ncbi:MAG: M20/M25/M40 family metallo-hydrolase [Candidatus Acidiferrales bacterium]
MSGNAELTKKLLRDLVAIDSVNPTLVAGARGESVASQFLFDFLLQHGIRAELEEAAPGRPNVVALIEPVGAPAQESEKKTAALAILAHIDTVGAGDMPDPFTPREREGRLHGRGALDIKSGVAAMCVAAIAARNSGKLKKPLLISAVVDEECNSIGTEALMRRYLANAAVVLEPTDLRLTIAHKGYAWFEIVTHGRSAHGSLPGEGRDAIRMMGRVLSLLDALDRKLSALLPHPLLGHGSLHASLIRGGQELSSYPAQCRLQLERRTLPGESAAEIEAEIRGVLAGLETRDAEFRATVRGLAFRPPYEISADAPFVQSASEAIQKVMGSVELAGMAAWTDTALLATVGIPGVVFGPRGRGLHGSDEYVELDSVVQCSEVLYELILSNCC